MEAVIATIVPCERFLAARPSTPRDLHIQDSWSARPVDPEPPGTTRWLKAAPLSADETSAWRAHSQAPRRFGFLRSGRGGIRRERRPATRERTIMDKWRIA